MARVAQRAGWAEGSQSRLETGVTPIRPEQLAVLADILQLSPVTRMRLDRALGVEHEPDQWWVRYAEVLNKEYEELIQLESLASSIGIASTLVPGQMQAEGYARATITRSSFVPDPDDVEMLLALRMERQRALMEGGMAISVTLSAAALWQSFCGRLALQEQLRNLVELSRLDNVSLRVVPFEAVVVPFLGAVTLLDLPMPASSVVQAEWDSGSQIIKDSRSVKRYRRNLEHQRDAALSEDESRRAILTRLEAL